MVMNKILFWSGFGVAVRLWQLGMEARPLFNRKSLWAYPVYAALGGSVGYYLQGVDDRQTKLLADRRDRLIEKRKAAKARMEAEAGGAAAA